MSVSTGTIKFEGTERLADLIMSLQRCFLLHLSKELTRGQVSFPQYFLLGLIAGKQSLSMSEVAEKMHHSTAAATGLVDRLENLQYVERTHAPNDRRKVLVRITNKGSALVDRIRQDVVTNLEEIMELLSPEERDAWLRVYEKIHSFCQSTDTPCDK